MCNCAQRPSKLCTPLDPATQLLGLHHKKTKEKGKGSICTEIFRAALLLVANNQKLRACPSTEERLSKSYYMTAMEYDCAILNEVSEKPGKTCESNQANNIYNRYHERLKNSYEDDE